MGRGFLVITSSRVGSDEKSHEGGEDKGVWVSWDVVSS